MYRYSQGLSGYPSSQRVLSALGFPSKQLYELAEMSAEAIQAGVPEDAFKAIDQSKVDPSLVIEMLRKILSLIKVEIVDLNKRITPLTKMTIEEQRLAHIKMGVSTGIAVTPQKASESRASIKAKIVRLQESLPLFGKTISVIQKHYKASMGGGTKTYLLIGGGLVVAWFLFGRK